MLLEDVVGPACPVEGAIQVDLGIGEVKVVAAVQDLDLLGHGIEDARGVVADGTGGDHVEVDVNAVELVLVAPAVLVGAILGVHDAHAGEGRAGGCRGGNRDDAEACVLAGRLGDVDELAAADAYDLVGVPGKRGIGEATRALVRAPAAVHLDVVLKTGGFEAGLELLGHGGPGTRVGDDEDALAEAGEFLSKLGQEVALLAIAAGAKFDGCVELGVDLHVMLPWFGVPRDQWTVL